MTTENRKIAFICSKGNLDMAYPALVMSWAALGNVVDVTIFFTFWGMDMINKKRVDHLEIPPVGIAGMKMSMMGLPTGNLGIPQIMGVLPGMTAVATALLKSKMKGLEVLPSDAGGRRRQVVRLQDDCRPVRIEDGRFRRRRGQHRHCQ